MDIFVIGNASTKCAPDRVLVSATIHASVRCKYPAAQRHGMDLTEEEQRCKTEATALGITRAEDFFEKIIMPLGIDKQDVTTSRFNINSSTIDIAEDKRDREYVFDRATYSQNFNFEFDYDKNKIGKMMELFTENASFAYCDIHFGLKDETKRKFLDQVIADVYNNAYSQALSIAKAARYQDVECVAANHQAFNNVYLASSSSYGSADMMNMECSVSRKCKSVAERFVDIFNPEDIEVSKTIYYHFKGF